MDYYISTIVVDWGCSRSYQNRVVDALPNNYQAHLLENGIDLRTMQELLVHKHIKTMEIYTHGSQQTK